MPGLTHYVSLDGPAGVEMQFAEFVSTARRRHPGWSHALLNPGRSIHPLVRSHLRGSLRDEFPAKQAGFVRLPAFPRALRAAYCRYRLKQAMTSVVLIWNRSARVEFVLAAAQAGRCVHFEHGAAWFSGHERERRAYFARIPLAIANSHAAERVLRLLWRFEGPIEVCRNALRPSLAPGAVQRKTYPSNRTIRLGVAARLFPVKGVALVIQALRVLHDAHVDVELHVAGDGPERARLGHLADSLGLAGSVIFHGVLGAMHDFYRSVDCLVHVPISEAFGLVAIEAGAYGCPVIAARVDGLPEALGDGQLGRCLAPELPIADYAALGGARSPLPALVYDPAGDALITPRVVAPSTIADAVVALLSSAQSFEARSLAASTTVARDYAFDDHVDRAVEILDRFHRSQASR